METSLPETPPPLYTVAVARAWEKAYEQQLEDQRNNCEFPLQILVKSLPEKIARSLWNSGAWLTWILRESGASDQQINDIAGAHGQRSFYRDPWEVAVAYVNEFVTTGDTKEKGGMLLAQQLVDEQKNEQRKYELN